MDLQRRPSDKALTRTIHQVQRATRSLARRYRLPRDQEHDLAGTVVLKLLQKDRRALQSCAAAEKPRAYYRTAARRVLIDQRTEAWGRWRPCAEARRLGTVAVAYDRCVHRDGLEPREALETLRLRGHCAVQLETAARRIPPRVKRRFVDAATALENAEAPLRADHRVLDAEHRQAAHILESVFQDLPRQLGADGLELLRLRFEEGLSVRQIARRRGEPTRPLYRRFERLLLDLRQHLEAAGLTRERALSAVRSGLLGEGLLGGEFLGGGLLGDGLPATPAQGEEDCVGAPAGDSGPGRAGDPPE